MGTFQSGINNILAEAGVGAKLLGDVYRTNKENEILEAKNLKAKNLKEKLIAERKAKELEAQKLKEQQQAEQEALAEKESIKQTQTLIDDALNMSLGYNASDIKKQKASKDLGINLPQKNPRGVSNKTFDRRLANLKAYQQILNQFIQNKDFRERINKYTAKDLSGALNPQIRGRKKIVGSDNNVSEEK